MKLKTEKIVIKGLVQGIGYRPFVAELAEKYEITGYVRNTSGIVTVLATAREEMIERFAAELTENAPIGARVDELVRETKKIQQFDGFAIVPSEEATVESEIPQILPDLPTCDRCRSELWDKQNRRYRHPFISCVSCGPRYSVIERIPYDREHITMADFELCEECTEEYTARGNIRRHAQTIACPDCGPKLVYEEMSASYGMQCKVQESLAVEAGAQLECNATKSQETALQMAVDLLKNDGILALKDIGGFHLACSPYSEQGVERLRKIKGRERKPFAVMFADIETIRDYAELSLQEEAELTSLPRPIVLLRRKKNLKQPFAYGVCKNSPDIGAMLPCNPLQELLLAECGVLIMTSANRSGEPMITDNDVMRGWMEQSVEFVQEAKKRSMEHEQSDSQGFCGQGRQSRKIRLGMLSHKRRIVTPLDDSIVRIVNGRRQIFRRARGFVPKPIKLRGIEMRYNKEGAATKEELQIFAAGADMKACFSYIFGNMAYLSQHFGDLMDEEIQRLYQREATRMKELFGFKPRFYAADLHPGYISTKLAQQNYTRGMQIQHHHAHVASVMAEHGLSGDVLGIAFDGTGYGTDKTVWGSEFLLCNGSRMRRVAHLKPTALIGGDEGARNADTILYGYLASCNIDPVHLPEWLKIEQYRIVKAAVAHRINTITSTSMGRLFDAVSALLDICHYNSYEGEAAIELEYLAVMTTETYPLSIIIEETEAGFMADTGQLFVDIFEALEHGVDTRQLARGFLSAIADFVIDGCVRLRELTNVTQIALSGGSFQNRILLETVWKGLENKGFFVYRNEQVPSGDGGISLGQAYLMCMQQNEAGTE